MGASQYKKKRVTERESGPSKSQAEELRKKKRDRILYTVGGILLVLFIAVVAFVNSSLFTRGLAAVKVNDASYSVAQTRYAYQSAYNQFYETYQDYISFMLDPSQPLSEQDCSMPGYEGKTWDDYFKDAGVESLRQLTVLNAEAKAAGYELSEEDRSSIENNLATLGMYAQVYGYTTDGYIALYYGEGNNETTVRQMLELSQLASSFGDSKRESYTYTDEALDDYYANVADDYSTFNYFYTFLAADDEDALDDAREDAEAIMDAAGESVEAFKAAVLEQTGTEATEQDSSWSSLSDLKDWFTDPARVPGDMTTVETSSGIRVYCFQSVEDNNYRLANVRHILIRAKDEDGDGVYSDEEKEAALTALKDIEAQWDGTEEGFIALAEQYSEDPGSNTNGGLYENIVKGSMVEEFDDFCFAKHKSGDTDIVYGESDNYAGYHFVYYVGEGQLYSRYIAKNLMSNEDYQSWLDALMANYPAKRTFMFRYV